MFGRAVLKMEVLNVQEYLVFLLLISERRDCEEDA